MTSSRVRMTERIDGLMDIIRSKIVADCIVGIFVPLLTTLIVCHISGVEHKKDYMTSFSSLLSLTLPLIIMVIERTASFDNPISAITIFSKTKTGMLLSFILSSLLCIKIFNCRVTYTIFTIIFIVISTISYIQTTILFINRDLMFDEDKQVRRLLLKMSNKTFMPVTTKKLLRRYFISFANKAKQYVQTGDTINSKITLDKLNLLFNEYLKEYKIAVERNKKDKNSSLAECSYELSESYKYFAQSLINYCKDNDLDNFKITNEFIIKLLEASFREKQIIVIKKLSKPFSRSNCQYIEKIDYIEGIRQINEILYQLIHIAKEKGEKDFAGNAAIELCDSFIKSLYTVAAKSNQSENLINDILENLKELADSINHAEKIVLDDNVFAILAYIYNRNYINQDTLKIIATSYFESIGYEEIESIHKRITNHNAKNENYSNWELIAWSVDKTTTISKEKDIFSNFSAFILSTTEN